MFKINVYTLDVATPTSSLWLSVGCKGTWGQKSVVKSETHSHEWGKVQKIKPNDFQMHSHFGSCIRVRVLNI
jgi:hypothetical protein